MIPPARQERALSKVLEDCLAAVESQGTTIGDLIDGVAERGFGLVLVLLALPTLIPVLPPGASAVVGALYAILGAQMALGAKGPWLPRRIRRHRLSEKTVNGLRTRGLKLVRRLEATSRPRWEFMSARLITMLLGLVIVGIGILLFLPLPFMNTAPGLAMLVMGVGLANRDGLLVLLGALLSAGLIFGAIRFGHILIWLSRSLRSRLPF